MADGDDTNGFVEFDLSIINTQVLGAQNIDQNAITYHLNQAGADSGESPLPNLYTNLVADTQQLIVRVANIDNTSCYITAVINLIVYVRPLIVGPDSIRICNSQVNTIYDLTIREDQITGGDNTIVLSYFESQLDLDNSNPVVGPTQYTNTILDRDLLVLATGTNLCFSTTTTLSLKTILYANLNITPTAIVECEIDNNGFDYFDITRREIEILNGLDAADFIFTYYEDEADAIAGNTNNIVDTFNFENTQINTQTIYVRVLPVNNECYIVEPLTLIVNPIPEIAVDDQYVICLDSNHDVINPVNQTFLPNPPIDTKLSDTEFTFQWYSATEAEVNTDPNSVIIAGAISSTYAPTVAGNYTVIATNIATGCRIPASTIVVGSYPPESISVKLGTNAFSDNNIIEVSVIGNGEYEFRLDFDPWQRSLTFEGVTGGEHVIYVRDLLNCNVILEIQIVVDYPKFFTPNGDGYNDTWNIKGIATQPNSKIYIFDRYGKLLKQLSPTENGWNGIFNGKRLPSSDYWFVVEYKELSDGVLKQFKAHFSLKR